MSDANYSPKGYADIQNNLLAQIRDTLANQGGGTQYNTFAVQVIEANESFVFEKGKYHSIELLAPQNVSVGAFCEIAIENTNSFKIYKPDFKITTSGTTAQDITITNKNNETLLFLCNIV